MEKTKTALQEHIEWLEDTLSLSKEHAPILENCLKLCISDAKLRLAKEEEQIIQAVYDGMCTTCDPNIGRAKQYYIEKFEVK